MTSSAHRADIVLVAHDVGGVGGMERVLDHHVRALATTYRVTVVSCTLVPELRSSVHRWVRIPAPASPVSIKLAVFALLSTILLRTRLRGSRVLSVGCLTLARVDLVALHFYHHDYVRVAGALANVGGSRWRRFNTSLVRLMSLGLERRTFAQRRPPVVLPVSAGLERAFRADHPDVPAALVPNGVGAAEFAPARGDHPDGPVQVLFVGGDWARKGVPLLLEALRLLDGRGVDVRLRIVGRGDAAQLNAQAEHLGIHSRVEVSGPTPDVAALYRAADIFCLPSEYETFGLVAYEAAACGLPLVGTAVHGVDELLAAGAGVEVTRTAIAVAEALELLARDGNLRRRMGVIGRQFAAERTWEGSAAALLAAVAPHGPATRG